ncbi:MAG: hypothetical protein ABJH98_17775 [Reichenbachiella sp.]|uniref:hypothetical protein n=1 Tax=Reichenbachiella sp. TaxID=2184521 RepID=UPI0032990CBE
MSKTNNQTDQDSEPIEKTYVRRRGNRLPLSLLDEELNNLKKEFNEYKEKGGTHSSLSPYARERVLSKQIIIHTPVFTEKEFRLLSALSNNLNQLTKSNHHLIAIQGHVDQKTFDSIHSTTSSINKLISAKLS